MSASQPTPDIQPNTSERGFPIEIPDASFRRALPPEARESRWATADGTAVRRFDWGAGGGPARGSILFVPGRGEFYEKYFETFAYWHRAGWCVSAIDWRGQGASGRLGADDRTGHIDDFSTWVGDLAHFWAGWRAEAGAPRVLVGHSMGGHLAMRAVAEGAVDPAALVLSAPMLGMQSFGLPTAAGHALARVICALGDRRRPAWKTSEKPFATDRHRIHLLTHDVGRYEDEAFWRTARPELDCGPASWGWVERAYASVRVIEQPGRLEAVQTPVLILGTSADGLVSWPAIRRAAARLPHGELVAFGREARHELLREADGVRDACLAAIDEFLRRVAPNVATQGASAVAP